MLRKNVYELILIKEICLVFFYIIKPVVELCLLMFLINQSNNGISITCVNYKTKHFINPKIQQLYNQSPTSTTLLKHNIPAAYVLLIKQHYSCMKVFIKLSCMYVYEITIISNTNLHKRSVLSSRITGYTI